MNITKHILLLLLCVSLYANTEKYRLIWNDNPATTMTIAWNQVNGSDYCLYYGKKKDGSDWISHKPDRQIDYRGMNNQFVRLKNLQPSTAYYFQIKDDNSKSEVMWFLTAPDTPQSFSFIAGGDSRTNKEPRVNGNKLVAKIRPLFIAHGGDYLADGTASEWQMWFDEWQLTKSSDGRMYPIVPAHGNHENADRYMIYNLFDLPDRNAYYAFNIAGDLLRLYTLNTELEPEVGYGAFALQTSEIWDKQNKWFEQDLRENNPKWKIVNYHRPLRPHTSAKKEGLGRISAWGEYFYKYNVNLAIECDTHMVKYTYPVRYSENTGSFESFIRDDKRGTVFMGEGSWGAPTRPTDDDKPWTLASDSFWQYKLIHVTPDKIQTRTVRYGKLEDVKKGIHYNESEVVALTQKEQDKNPLAIPQGITLWKPLSGEVLELPFTGAKIDHRNYVSLQTKWKYSFSEHDNWKLASFGDFNWETTQGNIALAKAQPVYMRKNFVVDHDPHSVLRLNLRIICQDGAIVYINGQEVAHYNVAINENIEALRSIEKEQVVDIPIPNRVFRKGQNCIAVAVYPNEANRVTCKVDLTSIIAQNTLQPPLTPKNLKVTLVSDKQVNVSWQIVANASYYQLERRKENGIWEVVKQRIYNSLYVDRALEGSTDYEYRVFAINHDGISTENQIKVTTPSTPENVLLQETFSQGLGNFTSVSTASNADWKAQFKEERYCALISGYGADIASSDWLVSPQIDLSDRSSPKLKFAVYTKYEGGQILFKISSNYNGNPNLTTWETQSVSFPASDSRTWVDCTVDLKEFVGKKIHFAFHYTSGIAEGDASRWCISNVELRDGDRHIFTKETVEQKKSHFAKNEVRIATFNVSMYRSEEGELLEDLSTKHHPQICNIAETLQRVRPEVVLINEFDYVANNAAAKKFIKNYLHVSQNGAKPIDYPYFYAAPSNTGVDSKHDLNNDGVLGGADDAFGYGAYPGQYSMLILSQHPIEMDKVRTFQKFRWVDMPGALLPKHPGSDKMWYSEEKLNVLRLSSKNHCDVPVNVNGETIHILASHPTPPVFDGEEDRNGKRNHDEVRFWHDYVHDSISQYIYDDKGGKGGIKGKRFVIVGDLNASLLEQDALKDGIGMLLFCKKVNDKYIPESKGGIENDLGNEIASTHTARWKLRVDYVLPSTAGLRVENGAVFWPEKTHEYYRLVCSPEISSDHRLVYLDLQITE